jgi:hypothetical protein
MQLVLTQRSRLLFALCALNLLGVLFYRQQNCEQQKRAFEGTHP